MRHEREIRPAPGAGMIVGERLTRQTLRSGPIGVLPRTLDPAVVAELDALPVHRLPRLRLEGDLKTLRREVPLRLAKAEFGPDWLAEWLVNDLSFLGLMFEQLTGAQRLCLRLDVIEDDACRKFHVDNVFYRLVTTYRGPGTQWLPPHVSSPSRRAPRSQVTTSDSLIAVGSPSCAVLAVQRRNVPVFCTAHLQSSGKASPGSS
ncbi:DUF1826 domain-containing protein (plasmid) [Microvirga sp. VF16]|nr:DUF1826 domain-containing protein [Microvirga sp. VF16]QRM33208.1 DUF1826 domain-containing protein [Microvirga sp. VF16]